LEKLYKRFYKVKIGAKNSTNLGDGVRIYNFIKISQKFISFLVQCAIPTTHPINLTFVQKFKAEIKNFE